MSDYTAKTHCYSPCQKVIGVGKNGKRIRCLGKVPAINKVCEKCGKGKK